MIDTGGIIRTKRSKLGSDDLQKIDSALNDPNRYSSYEKSALAAIIWLLFFSTIGLVGAAIMTDWPQFTDFIKKGEWLLGFYSCPEGYGFIASLIILLATIWYWITIRGRFGYILLPDAIGRVRGNRITIIPVRNIANAVSSRVETFHDPSDSGYHSVRSFTVVRITMNDGKKFNLYAPKLDLSILGDKLRHEK